MKNNKSDTFEGIKKINLAENNFFLANSVTDLNASFKFNSETSKRLNGYDSNLLEEDAYKDLSDEIFKLEYKITRIEEELKSYEMQIQAAKDISDCNLLNELINRKSMLERDYKTLLKNYNDRSFSAKITDNFLKMFGKKEKTRINYLKNLILKFSKTLVSIMPKQFSSLLELKKSLSKLENLNKSVDDLISMNIPYGENYNKYDQLSKYIIKANSIQADISRNMKK